MKKMQKELDSRKKLNKMLLKEISKLKANDGKGSASKNKDKKDRGFDKTFNLFKTGGKETNDRLNRSLL
jgi:hypothetical protein